jgi:ribosomal protein S1
VLGEVISDHPFSHDFLSGEYTAQWEQLKQQLPIGSLLTGKVWARMPFGVFFDAGVGFPVLLEVIHFGKKRVHFPDDYPELASQISGRLVGFDKDNRQLRVTNTSVSSSSELEA